MGRVVIFGDIGGHAAPLHAKLRELGATPSGCEPAALVLPADLTVVFVGDLVHRGPDSEGVVAIVDHLICTQPDQVVALAGNHEAQYVHRWRFGGYPRIDEAAADRLCDWWGRGQLRAAAVVRTAVGEDLLVTHAGLTHGLWDWLGSPATAELACAAVNALIPDDKRLHRAGIVLEGGPPDYTAGPLWADAFREVLMSWVDRPARDHRGQHAVLPFSQVHGHSSVFWFAEGKYVPTFPAFLRPVVHVDTVARHTITRLAGGRIVGVDPCHGKDPAPTWEPLVLPDAAVVAR